MTLLIVDDDPNSLHNMYTAIGDINAEHTVIKAINGRIAFEMAKKHQPDLIITDWEMPEVDGITFIKMLKGHRYTEDIPVIMATGVMTSSENLQTALDAGAVDYIRKPIDPIELRARMQSMLKLSASFKEIKRLNATKDRIFSIIAHDLRSPLNFLQGILTIFQLGGFDDPDELKKMMANASMNVQSISELLDNLLSWAKIQIMEGSLEMSPDAIALDQMVKEVGHIYEEMRNQKGIELIYLTPEDLPKVWADKEAIKLTLRNLLSNGLKFTSKNGTVTVQLEKQGESVRVSVRDTGVGIAKVRQQKLFHGIVDSSKGTEKEKGTGLGLMLCKDSIERNKGEIGVESEEGKGSEFWFTLPIHKS